MLFVAVCKAKSTSTTAERVTRRAQWSYPEGINLVAEYWLQTSDPAIPVAFVVFETNDVASLMAGIAAWDKDFDMTFVPAVTAEEGLNLAQQMMQQ